MNVRDIDLILGRHDKFIENNPVPWKVVKAGQPSPMEGHLCEDDSIFDANGAEVLGCSEWLRVDDGCLEFIVDLVNMVVAGYDATEHRKQAVIDRIRPQ